MCKRERERELNPDEEVLVLLPTSSNKLLAQWQRPYRILCMLLSGLQWSSCIVHIEDIIVVGQTFDKHLNNMKQVFESIKKAGLKLHPSKCQFLQPKV